MTRKVELWIFFTRFTLEKIPQNNFSRQKELGKVNVRSRMVLSKGLSLVVELSRAHTVCKIKFGINKLPLVFFCDVTVKSEIAIIFQFFQKKNSKKFKKISKFFFRKLFSSQKIFHAFLSSNVPRMTYLH